MSQLNPRYVEYARAHGSKTPQEQMDADRVTWPGGVMTGFICWIGERWTEWDKLQGRKIGEPHIGRDHAAFDAWLATRAPQPATLAERKKTCQSPLGPQRLNDNDEGCMCPPCAASGQDGPDVWKPKEIK